MVISAFLLTAFLRKPFLKEVFFNAPLRSPEAGLVKKSLNILNKWERTSNSRNERHKNLIQF